MISSLILVLSNSFPVELRHIQFSVMRQEKDINKYKKNQLGWFLFSSHVPQSLWMSCWHVSKGDNTNVISTQLLHLSSHCVCSAGVMDEEDKQMWRDEDRGDEDRSPSDIDDVSVCAVLLFIVIVIVVVLMYIRTKEQSKVSPHLNTSLVMDTNSSLVLQTRTMCHHWELEMFHWTKLNSSQYLKRCRSWEIIVSCLVASFSAMGRLL